MEFEAWVLGLSVSCDGGFLLSAKIEGWRNEYRLGISASDEKWRLESRSLAALRISSALLHSTVAVSPRRKN